MRHIIPSLESSIMSIKDKAVPQISTATKMVMELNEKIEKRDTNQQWTLISDHFKTRQYLKEIHLRH